MTTTRFNRRKLLRAAGVAGVGVLASACAPRVAQPTGPMSGMQHGEMSGMMGAGAASSMPAGASRVASAGFSPDVEFTLRATAGEARLLPGPATRVLRYDAALVKGDASALQTLPDTYLGPILRVKQGQKVRVNFRNDLPAADQLSIVHWHGMHLAEAMDGHPRYAIAPGGTYAYEFTVTDAARSAWFHPHPHMRTAEQVHNGLAGMILVSDDVEGGLGLPSGEFDLPIVLQDRTFDRANQFVYGGGMMGGMMDQLMGFLGERMLVNGRPDFVLNAEPRLYRLRVLNGSNARIYKLAWSDGAPLTVIGTDGGLLEKPVQKPYAMLAPGERIELWADFGGRKAGEQFTLNSLAYSGADDPAEELAGSQGGMMGAMRGTAPALGVPLTLFTVNVTRNGAGVAPLPAGLRPMERYRIADAANRNQPRTFTLAQQNMRWKINGREWEPDAVADDETVKLNTTEVWEIVNASNPGEMMHRLGMAHPFHVHGRQFQVLERTLAVPELKPGYDSVREGYLNDGWKDTVMVMPGERVKLLMRFSDHAGTFLYHCHILEHEDMGMMRNYKIT